MTPAELPRLRRHTDGRLAQLANRHPRWRWHVTLPGNSEAECDLPSDALCYHAKDEDVSGQGWSELVVVELPEPIGERQNDVDWPGAGLTIHRPEGTTIWPSLPADLAGWDDAPRHVREVIAPSLIAAALYAERYADPSRRDDSGGAVS